MFHRLKRQWRDLRDASPGNRFQAQFERSQRANAHKSRFRRCVPVLAGAVLLIAGVILCFIPGPGLPLIFLGAGMLAERFRAVARAMDWLEVKLRKMKKRWVA